MPDPNINNMVRMRLQGLAKVIDGTLPDGALFCLVVFTNQETDDDLLYVSNGDASDIAKALRKMATRLETRTKPPIPN